MLTKIHLILSQTQQTWFSAQEMNFDSLQMGMGGGGKKVVIGV